MGNISTLPSLLGKTGNAGGESIAFAMSHRNAILWGKATKMIDYERRFRYHTVKMLQAFCKADKRLESGLNPSYWYEREYFHSDEASRYSRLSELVLCVR